MKKILTHSFQEPDNAPAGGGAVSDGGAEASSFDYAGLAEHDDAAPTVADAPVSPSASGTGDGATAVPASPAAAAAPSAPAATSPAVAPTPTPVAPSPVPPQAAAPAAVAPESQAQPAPEQLNFEQHRAAIMPKLQELYKLSDEEAAAFQANPGESIPALAARLHYEVQLSTFNSVLSAIPQLLSSFMDQRSTVEKAETEFYSAWPALKNDTYKATIVSTIKAIKAANPNMTQDQVMKQAGLIASITLGIPVESPGVAAPAVPAVQAAAPVARQIPGRPAGIGASAAPLPAQNAGPGGAETNIFADIVDAYESGQI